MRLRSLDQEERTLDIDKEMIIEELLVDFAQTLQSHNPSVQNQDIDPPKGLECLV